MKSRGTDSVKHTSTPNLQVIMAASCSVCCEYYNKSTRAEVKCCFGDCNFGACKSCVRKYLLSSTNDPHCMNCKKSWNQDFMAMNLNRSFVSKEYKETRMDLLLEKEMSKMPQTMEAAQRERDIENERKEIAKIDDEIQQLTFQIGALNKQKRQNRERIFRLRNISEKEKGEKRKFIMPCPGNDCRGFLSSQYKCEMCEMYTCPKCLVIIGPNKNCEHTCNEDMVKSAELIKQETKPCPSCGTRISKISGCNQMWCTNCHVAFSWSTGTIDNGPVHNPHFYEYQKTVDANGVAPRNPGDVVCGGLCNIYTLRTTMNTKFSRTSFYHENRSKINNLNNIIQSLHRVGLHISEVLLPQYREQARDIDHNESLRVEYILKKKSKEELRSTIYQRDFTRQKNKELLYIMELINVSLIEIFAQIVTSKNECASFVTELENYLEQIKTLFKYCNEQLETISVSYNRSVPTLLYCEVENKYYKHDKNHIYEWCIVDRKFYSYSKKKKQYNEMKKPQPTETTNGNNGAASEN